MASREIIEHKAKLTSKLLLSQPSIDLINVSRNGPVLGTEQVCVSDMDEFVTLIRNKYSIVRFRIIDINS